VAAITVPSLLQVGWLLTFRGMSYSPRFLLTSFVGAFALPAAFALDRWLRTSRVRTAMAAMALLLPLAAAVPLVRARSAALEATLVDWPVRLERLDGPAVIVSGLPCAAVPYVRQVLEREPGRDGRDLPWTPVCPGWAWPPDLPRTLDGALLAGESVVLDLRPASWVGAEQLAARRQVAEYAATRAARRGLIVWR
jgi:hypothetical protein